MWVDCHLGQTADLRLYLLAPVQQFDHRHYDRKTEINRRYTRSASLRLNGHWMEEAGFTTGTPLDVRVMPGCLVITTRPAETSFMKDLNKINRLPEKEQEQVRRFLMGVAAKVMPESV